MVEKTFQKMDLQAGAMHVREAVRVDPPDPDFQQGLDIVLQRIAQQEARHAVLQKKLAQRQQRSQTGTSHRTTHCGAS